MRRLLAGEFGSVSRRSCGRPAVVDEGATLSYDRLLRWSEAISMVLDHNRQLDGSRVALMLPNSAAFIASFFAVARVGGVAAPLNVGYRSQELEHYLTDIDPAAVLVHPTVADRVRETIERLPRKPFLLLVERPGTCEAVTAGDTLERSRPPSGDPPLLLLYTSGSTGPPKRVIRTHAQLLTEVETLRTLFRVSPDDRFLGAAPFFHVNGLVRSMLTAMLGGATIYPIQQFSRRTVLQLISRQRLTFFGGVPPMFILLTQTPPRGAVDLSSLRIVFSSSAALTPRDNQDFCRAYGFCIRQLYGSTETGTISYNSHSKPEEHLESVGTALPGVTLAVLDEEGGRLPAGREGEITVSSSFAIASYEGNTGATKKSFRDGFYSTGDLGRMDCDGHLTLTGRKSLMINRGGYKVNPYEVEAAIRQHPKVADVVVVSGPGQHGEQSIRCLVVVADGHLSAEEIILHCRTRIADYKIPSRIEFRNSLPRTSTGKVRRDLL